MTSLLSRHFSKKLEQGVIYTSVKSEFRRDEALYSARSLKRYNPDINVTFFTDSEEFTNPVFDKIVYCSSAENPLKCKIKNFFKSPYKKTLYLDTDTLVLGEITHLFDLLDEYNFVLSPNPRLDTGKKTPEYIPGNPKKGYNTGLVLYNDKKLTKKYLKKWFDYLDCRDDDDMWPGHYGDQFHFNDLEARLNLPSKMGVKIYKLNHEIYNVRHHAYKYLNETGRIKDVLIAHDHRIYKDECPFPYFGEIASEFME